MEVSKDKVITVTYVLHSNLEGQEKSLVEETGNENPLVFLFGSGQLIPAFEENLLGLIEGNDFSFSIEADNAYGLVDEEAIIRVPDDMFKVDGVIDLDVLRIGNMVPLMDKEGNQLVARIAGIEGNSVTLDFNHPLAGHFLHFSGKVVGIRDASAEELEHGHAHQPGMHDH